MRQLLAHALSKHKDQPLTLEVARQIMADVETDRSIDPAQFRVENFEGYRLQCERVAGIERQLDPLHAGYLAATQPHINPLAPFPYGRLLEQERAGNVLMATARDGTGRLAGLMRVRLYLRMDADVLGLTDDMFYVMPQHRRSILASTLWRYCERCAFQLGVREAEIRTNAASEPLARSFGYRKVATIHQKVAHDASDYASVPNRHAKGVAQHDPVV